MVTEERTREEALVYEIEPDVQAALMKFPPGKWIALTPSEIVAVRDSATEAYQEARKRGIDSPILFEVPTGTPGTYYY